MLDETEDNEIFRCALSNEPHFIKNPVGLLCGHSICKKCLPKKNGIAIVKCVICNQTTDINIANFKESMLAKKAIQSNIHQLFTWIEKDFSKSFQNLCGGLCFVFFHKYC